MEPQPWCDECKKPKCECDWQRFLVATEFYRVVSTEFFRELTEKEKEK